MVDFSEKSKKGKATTTADSTDAPALDPALTEGTTSVVHKATPAPTVVTEYEETGFEHMTQHDFKVPFIVVLQSKSPQVEEGSDSQIEGAKAGMFRDSVSNQLFDGKTGIIVTPVHSVHQYLEWIPRDDGGGLVSVYDWQDPKVQEVVKKAGKRFGKLKIGDGNDLQESFSVFCLLHLPDGTRRTVVIGFASTQIPTYQSWMTQARAQMKTVDGVQRPIPLWSHKFRITTKFEKNKKGTWHRMAAAFETGNAETSRLAETDPIMKEAKEFRALLMAGNAQANFDHVERDDASSATDDSNYDI